MQVFTLAAASLPFILAGVFGEAFGSMKAGWMAMAAVFGVIATLCILLTWRTTRGHELFPESTGFKFSDIVDVVRHNRTFRYTLGIWAFGIIALNFLVSTAIYYFTYVMVYGESMTGMVFGILIGASLIYLPIIDYIARKMGKRTAFIIFASIWGGRKRFIRNTDRRTGRYDCILD
jgi:Na+/melibiose symporter-like transporter